MPAYRGIDNNQARINQVPAARGNDFFMIFAPTDNRACPGNMLVTAHIHLPRNARASARPDQPCPPSSFRQAGIDAQCAATTEIAAKIHERRRIGDIAAQIAAAGSGQDIAVFKPYRAGIILLTALQTLSATMQLVAATSVSSRFAPLDAILPTTVQFISGRRTHSAGSPGGVTVNQAVIYRITVGWRRSANAAGIISAIAIKHAVGGITGNRPAADGASAVIHHPAPQNLGIG